MWPGGKNEGSTLRCSARGVPSKEASAASSDAVSDVSSVSSLSASTSNTGESGRMDGGSEDSRSRSSSRRMMANTLEIVKSTGAPLLATGMVSLMSDPSVEPSAPGRLEG